MKIKEIIQLIFKEKELIFLSGLFLASVFFWGAIVLNKNFKTHSDVLIVQNQNGFSDYYALSRSADYLSKVLIESIYSEKFIERIQVHSGNELRGLFDEKNKRENLKKWNKMVRVFKKSDTGIISVEVYGATPSLAVQTSEAVLKVLTEDYYIFLGRGQDLDVRILSGPILEKTFGIFNLAFIVFGGFVAGVILSLMWFFMKQERESGDNLR